MRRLLIAASVVSFLGFFHPHEGLLAQRVEGRVIDPEGVPIAGASISVQLETRELARIVSDDEGRFRFELADPGDFYVVVGRLGYRTTQSILSLRVGDSIAVEFHLSIEALPIDPITVTASARPPWEHLQPPGLWEFWERKDYMERLGQGRFFTADDLQPLGGQPVTLMVTSLVPFFFAESHPDRPSSFVLRGRGGRCVPPLFLDGHLLRGLSGPPVLEDWIHTSQIAGVEIYRGASDVPGEYRVPGSDCGAVAVWSLRGLNR